MNFDDDILFDVLPPQCLVDENKDLHSEVRRLRDENTTLMRSSKDSKRDVETIQVILKQMVYIPLSCCHHLGHAPCVQLQ